MKKLLFVFAILAACIMLGTNKVSAQLPSPLIGNTIPDPNTVDPRGYNNDYFLEIAQAGGGLYLDSRWLYAAAYFDSTTTDFNITINHGRWGCGDGVDMSGSTNASIDTRFTFSAIDGSSGNLPDYAGSKGNGSYSVNGAALSCGDTVINLNSVGQAPTHLVNGYYAVLIHVGWNGSMGGRLNAFKISASGTQGGKGAPASAAYMGYLRSAPENGYFPYAYAIQRRRPAGLFQDEMRFMARIDCNLRIRNTAGATVRIAWQDADRAGAPGGAIPWDTNIEFSIYQYRNGNLLNRFRVSEPIVLGGQGAYRELYFENIDGTNFRVYSPTLAPFAGVAGIGPGGEVYNGTNGRNLLGVSNQVGVQEGDVFEWRWSDVQDNNGLQLFAPFDTFDLVSPTCPPPTTDVCPNIDGFQGSIPPNHTRDPSGNCIPIDVCPNIAGQQLTLPNDHVYDPSGNCIIPDVCLNIPGPQPNVPPGYVQDAVGNCYIPDNAPSISISQYCSPPNYGVTITVNDPDYATNGLRPIISYSINGGGFISARAGPGGSINVAMPNPAASFTINANSNGVYPNPPGGDADGNSNRSTGVRTIDSCVFDFTMNSAPNLPILDDPENPTSITYSTNAGFSGSASQVNGLSIQREFFFNRGGSYDSTNGTLTAGTSQRLLTDPTGNPAPGIENAPLPPGVTVTARMPSTQPVLGTTTRGVSSLAAFLPFRAGDYFCVRLTITPLNGWIQRSTGAVIPGTTSGSAERRSCVSLYDRPYMRVYGGDVYSGSGFGAGCAATTTNIIGFARQVTIAGNNRWIGSGAQFGVFASGNVQGFLSGTMRSSTRSNDLTFANTTSNATRYGGALNATYCMDNYWQSRSSTLTTTAGAPPSLHSLPDGQYQYAPGSNLTSTSPISGRIAIYIDGDVNITGTGITTSTSWTSLNTIPSVYVIVRGNIYISPTVTQLDGIYVAQPYGNGAPGGGRIFTCTDAGATPSTAALVGACRNRLTVNGALVATRVNFMRTAGSLRTANTENEPHTSTNIAEVIRHTPEIFLNTPSANSRPNVGNFEAVVSLPPTL